jgi:hypothetical protein
MELTWMIIAALLITCIGAVYVAYEKLSRGIATIRRELVQTTDNVFVQLEALMAVYAELRPHRGLPRMRGWAASPDLLGVLLAYMHEKCPAVVLECSSGISTLILAAAAKNNGSGRVVSLEHDAAYAKRTRSLLARHGLADWADVVDAPLVPVQIGAWEGRWYDTSGLDPKLVVNMLVIDGPPQGTNPMARFPALAFLRGRLSAGAVVVLDDASRPDEGATVGAWLSAYPELEELRAPRCEKGCRVLQLRSSESAQCEFQTTF